MSSTGTKKITQEYFDSIVNENMNDLDMEPQEAIDDAIGQLKAQGIDLSTICKYPLDEQKQLLNALARLHRLVNMLNRMNGEVIQEEPDEDTSEQEIVTTTTTTTTTSREEVYDKCIKELNLIKENFDKDLSFRCLATNSKSTSSPNAYVIFMNYFSRLNWSNSSATNPEETAKTDALITSFLSAFQSYVHQQSDVIDSNGLKMLIRLTGSDKNDSQSGFGDHPSVLQALLKCINTSCQMSESNRQFYVENGLCENLIELFTKHKENDNVLCEACQLVRSLLLDDDMRVEFGHSHEHAKYIASQLNGIDVLLQIGLENQSTLSDDTLANLMLTLSKLAVRNEYCQEICDKGGLKFILTCIGETHLKNLSLLKSSLSLLKSICNNDQVKHEATKSNAIELVKHVLEKYMANVQICELGCSALTPLLLRNVEASEKFYACQVHQVMIQILNVHSSKPKLVKQMCLALRNSISRCRQFGEKLIELKLEETLNTLLRQPVNNMPNDEIKALLRDMGCQVELKEMWTGAGKSLQN